MDHHTAQQANADQTELWNGPAGRAWVGSQALLDRMFMPLQNLLVEAVSSAGVGERVLDVGCGTGGTTLAISRRLGPAARCVGVDVSGPMVAVAQRRAASEGSPARFIQADAQVHDFEPGGFDMVVSRFGVMFFDDAHQAFANLRQAVRPGAAMHLLAWRSAEENPFMTAAERAAAPLLPHLPKRRPGAPGQFAFADRDSVATMLARSGWTDIGIRPTDVVCTFPESDLLRYLTDLGPVGLALQQADEVARARIMETVRPAFAPHVHGDEVRFVAACWVIEASARPA